MMHAWGQQKFGQRCITLAERRTHRPVTPTWYVLCLQAELSGPGPGQYNTMSSSTTGSGSGTGSGFGRSTFSGKAFTMGARTKAAAVGHSLVPPDAANIPGPGEAQSTL